MKAYIKKVSKGKQIGKYRFVLKGGNGEAIANCTESYASKQGCKATLSHCFPDFEIIDLTKEEK
jgi:uncharacterized protein YegP (UPF0339 family)